MYIDYEYFKTLYGEKLSESDFNCLLWEAEREIDKVTCGVDGIKKLKVAFPTDEYDIEVVKRCVCDTIDYISQLEKAQSTMISNGGIIASKTAGNESISYANDTSVNIALSSAKGKSQVINEFISEKLRSITDKNGVNLLFMGVYPYRIEV